MPFLIEDPKLAAAVKRRGIFESVGALQQSIRSRGEIAYSFSPEAEASLMRIHTHFPPLRPMFAIAPNHLPALAPRVRPNVPPWPLALAPPRTLRAAPPPP